MAFTGPPPPRPPEPPNPADANRKRVNPYRPNPSRAIEVFGDFTEDLSHKLLSQISALRQESNDPITVYINSIGGSVPVLTFVSGLLDARDIDRSLCRTITVAVGNAASAGAILLAFGDYAYAYEHSYIHFHGVRASDLPERFEDAAQLATELARTQRRVSLKLSQAIVQRVLFRFQRLKSSFDCRRKDISDKALVELRCFTEAIGRCVSVRARALVEKTFTHVQQARSLSDKILPNVSFSKGKHPARNDSRVLIGVIKHEVREGNKLWRIDERGVERVLRDYFVLRDYNLGEHWEFFPNLVDIFGPDFLAEPDLEEFKKKEATDPQEAGIFLRQAAVPRIRPLWYYTVSLCRALLEGENRLSPADAYWLGIVDEVVGTDMLGFRVVSERPKGEKRVADPGSAASTAAPRSQHSSGVPGL